MSRSMHRTGAGLFIVLLAVLCAAAQNSDTTPPLGPAQVTATAVQLTTITAQWDSGQDQESGISYYIYGIGTRSAGDYTSLANVKWWQVVYGNTASATLNLDPALTYYVSVYAVNGAGLWSAVAISNAVHPVWQNLGQPGNVIQLQFGATGYDASGNATSTFTPDQVALMTSFFNRMYPILVQVYGPPATSYTLTVVRDLRYRGSNEFIPATSQMRKDDSFNPQLFTHELVHAFRGTYILTADTNWKFDPTLDGFEEGFAQGVSYEAMNQYVAAYPNDDIVAGNTLWGSRNEWDYDFQNLPVLRGTDFWSDAGGTGLHWLKYEMAAAALRKINLESPGFYKAFNQQYYGLINANPASVRPTRPLIVGIVRSLAPQIEGMPADQWIDRQNIFYSQNVYGKKIFHKIQDYQWTQFFAFHSMYFLDTMSCGSEWACRSGSQYVYYHLNGSQGAGSLLDNQGNVVWSSDLSIQPSQNPSDGYFAFGSASMGLTTASSLLPWPGGDPAAYILNLNAFGLYRFDASFTDAATGLTTSDSIYRVMGAPIANNFSGVWGGVLGHTSGIVYLDHEGFAREPGIPVVNGAFVGPRNWTAIPNPRTGGKDSVPGRVFITFTDAGATYHAQRNIDYGSSAGSQMFLLDFTSAPADTMAPTVTITSPAKDASLSGAVTISASASDNVGVTRVEFYVDGSLFATAVSPPYSATWNASSALPGTHALAAKAYDLANNTATSTLSVKVLDTTPPAVAIVNPASGSWVSRGAGVTISASASDNVGVVKVEFYVNNVLKCADTAAPYTCRWTVPSLRGVRYTLRARAYDAANNTADATALVTSK